jgi:hypothetical protein
MSPWDTADGGRPTTGEKENTEQTKQRRRSRLDEPQVYLMELNLWGDEIEENPLTPLESSSRT